MSRGRGSTQPRFGLFVEGASNLLPRGRDDLRDLWRTLCEHFNVAPDRVDVCGITKGQILAMDLPHGVQLTTRDRLDATVDIEHRRNPFDVLIIAFDALPPNQNLLAKACLRTEVNFVLERFQNSSVLPAAFRAEAAALLQRYKANPATPRGVGRPPRGAMDIIYMAPKFEGLVLTDESAWRRVFQLKRTPNQWPRMGTSDTHLEQRFEKVVRVGRSEGVPPKHVRGDATTAKHAWAREAIRHAGANSALWKHEIAVRLGQVLAWQRLVVAPHRARRGSRWARKLPGRVLGGVLLRFILVDNRLQHLRPRAHLRNRQLSNDSLLQT